MRMRSRRLIRENEGATAVEFALIAPVVIFMLMGIVEFGLIMFATSVIEGATNVGSRLGKTGFTQAGMTREQYIRQEIRNMSGGLLDPNNVVINTRPYPTYSTSGNPPPEPCLTAQCGNGAAGTDYSDLNGNGAYDAVRSDAGAAGDVVVYQVTYNWPVMTPLFSHILRTNGGPYQISSVTTVRNEPF